MIPHVVVSCEHATALVPSRYRRVFRGASRALQSHRGSDLGALVLAREVARRLGAPLFLAPATRLLADPNRSLGHRRLFSEWSRKLSPDERRTILERYWRPHREAVERAIRRDTSRRRRVLHVSVHTFTSRWRGTNRQVDVALLYDPARALERAIADIWLDRLRDLRSDLRLRRNYPYRGNADGLTTHLRRVFHPDLYLGVEVEVSQSHPLGAAATWRTLRFDICTALERALTQTAEGFEKIRRRRG